MEEEGLVVASKIDIESYRNGLTRDEMVTYLSQYPYMAKTIAMAYPEYRLLALGTHWQALKGIMKSDQTLDEVLTAVAHDGRALEYASKSLLKKNPDLYMVAIKSNGLALRHVPNSYRYEGIYEEAIRSNPEAVGLVPEDELTKELIMIAVESDGLALAHVPKRRITKAISRAAVASNVRAIEYIPARFCDKGMALSAVSTHGTLLRYVPSQLVDEEIANAAVRNDGNALEFAPRRLITSKMCNVAIANAPMSLQYVPPKFLNDKIIVNALHGDWRAIRFVSSPSDTLLELAFEQSPLALEYFPNGKKNLELCESACERDAHAIRFVPRKLVSATMLRNWLSSFFNENGEKVGSPSLDAMRSLRNIDKDQLRDPSVAELMRRLGKRETKCAKWVRKSATFLVTEVVTCGKDLRPSGTSLYSAYEWYEVTFNITTRAKDLDSLSKLLGGNLSEVEFRDYPFDDYDPNRHDLSAADIPVATLRRIGAYDDSAYHSLVAAWGDEPEVHNPEEDVSLVPATRKDAILPSNFEVGQPFYYVSDLHLNHRLSNRFPKEATARQIQDFLGKLARDIVETAPEKDRKNTLLVLGDTSYNIDVARLFFKSLRENWKGRIICILGNHELWDWSAKGPRGRAMPTVDAVVSKYREMLRNFRDVWLIQNQALIFLRDMKAYHLSEDQLRDMDDDELTNVLYRSSYVVLGGIGFTGRCDSFNAEHGIYRDVVTSRKQDMELSSEFSAIHERIRNLAPSANLIVATHTPMPNWSERSYQPGWVYVNGHTHKNMFIESGDVRVYADNQIGYSGQSAGLMRFYIEGRYDPFRHLPDGVHEVERVDYRDFNRSREITIGSFTRKGRILMIKRESVYLFLFEWEKTGRLYLLSGGQISSLVEQDPDYYYSRLPTYVTLVKEAFSAYEKAINSIADEVSSFGGEGEVHGCIVDIDFFNHVYLDPFTGELSFYYATSTVDRYEYPSLDRLLNEHLSELLPAYNALLQAKAREAALIVKRGIDPESLEIMKKTDTLMYRPSSVIRSVQYLFDSSVVRIWNEDVLDYANNQEKRHLESNANRGNPSRNERDYPFVGV